MQVTGLIAIFLYMIKFVSEHWMHSARSTTRIIKVLNSYIKGQLKGRRIEHIEAFSWPEEQKTGKIVPISGLSHIVDCNRIKTSPLQTSDLIYEGENVGLIMLYTLGWAKMRRYFLNKQRTKYITTNCSLHCSPYQTANQSEHQTSTENSPSSPSSASAPFPSFSAPSGSRSSWSHNRQPPGLPPPRLWKCRRQNRNSTYEGIHTRKRHQLRQQRRSGKRGRD